LASARKAFRCALAAAILLAARGAAPGPPTALPPPAHPDRGTDVARAQMALAERLRTDAAVRLDLSRHAAAAADGTFAERAGALLRHAERQQRADLEIAARRRELAAAFATLGAVADRDARARLLLAGLAQGAAAAAADTEQLAARRTVEASLLRAASADRARTAGRLAAVEGEAERAGARWRATLRACLLGLAWSPRQAAAGPRPGSPPSLKRTFALDQHLDRGLLRAASFTGSRPPARRTLGPAAPVPAGRPLLPIVGKPELSTGPGLTIATAVAQVVSAPASGRVVFAAPIQGLGPLLIIDRGGGYHVVLAGLTRLDARRGDSLVAGQSVGEIAVQRDGPARLRVELRYRGVPVDPAPWLAAYQDKVRS
jgi:murein hydrolase activator